MEGGKRGVSKEKENSSEGIPLWACTRQRTRTIGIVRTNKTSALQRNGEGKKREVRWGGRRVLSLGKRKDSRKNRHSAEERDSPAANSFPSPKGDMLKG